MDKDLRILYFWSPGCTKCRWIEPKLEYLAKTNGLNIIKIDTSKEIDTALKYDVLGLPTLIFFRGEKEVRRFRSRDFSMDAIENLCIEISKEG